MITKEIMKILLFHLRFFFDGDTSLYSSVNHTVESEGVIEASRVVVRTLVRCTERRGVQTRERSLKIVVT